MITLEAPPAVTVEDLAERAEYLADREDELDGQDCAELSALLALEDALRAGLRDILTPGMVMVRADVLRPDLGELFNIVEYAGARYLMYRAP